MEPDAVLDTWEWADLDAVNEPVLAERSPGAALLARLDRIEQLLLEHRAPPLPQFVSKRRAAQLLGVNRDATLEALIHSGRLVPVRIGSRDRIPLAQIERLAQQGDVPAARPERTRGRARRALAAAPPPADVAEQIRKLKLS